MDLLSSNAALMMERSMGFLWSKQAAILDNISNAETPGYQAKYVTFEEALRDRLSTVRDHAPAAQARRILSDAAPVLHEAAESTRMDGNGVNVTEQNLELSRNAIQLQYALQTINSDFSLLRTAIKGQ